MAQNNPGPSPARDQNLDRILKTINSIPVTPAVGCITAASATPVSNSSTATLFALLQGGAYLIQCDTPCYVASGTTSALAITAVTSSSATVGGFLCDNTAYGAGYLLILQPGYAFVAVVPTSTTTVNAKFFQLV